MPPAPPPLAVRAARALVRAERAFDADDDEAAVRLAQEAEEHGRAAGDLVVVTRAIVLSSRMSAAHGDFAGSQRQADEAFEIAEGIGDPAVVAVARIARGGALLALGDVAAGLDELTQAWTVLERGSDGFWKVRCANMLGVGYADLGELEYAQDWYQVCARLAGELGRHEMAMTALFNTHANLRDLGERLFAHGDDVGARRTWETCLAEHEKLLRGEYGPLPGRLSTYALLNCAESLERLARDEEALDRFVAVQQCVDAPVNAETRLGVYRHVGRILLRRGDLEGAREEVETGIAAAEGSGVKAVLPALYELASQIAELSGDLPMALERFKQFHDMHSHVIEQGKRHAQLLAARLDTSRAEAEAAAERERSQALEVANADLVGRASELEQEALSDALTGLANRRRLDEELATSYQDAVAGGAPLCVAVLDLDHFKWVNDSFTHAVGDEVLRQVGAVLRMQARDGDLVARYGGEEFVLMLPRTELADAGAAVERLRSSVRDHPWSEIDPDLAVTVSAGVCDVVRYSDLATGMLRADALLYAAKAAGRDRVVLDARG